MKKKIILQEKWKGFTDTLIRFPLTILLLIAAVISNTLVLEIHDNEIYLKLLITFLFGASLCVVFQMLYERFFTKPVWRISFMALTAAATAVYFLIIRMKEWETEIIVRVGIIFFILFIAFLWIPVIKSSFNFNESFMAVFKGFFTAIFFNAVLYLGVVLIIAATDRLIIPVDEQAYLHAMNLIFVLVTPVYFLTLLPVYPGLTELYGSEPSEIIKEKRLRMISPSVFLEGLISYVMIPITAIFTVILFLYIIMNITGEFWTDSLMEPLLVSYSITVIIVYLLASVLHNKAVHLFQKIFPKILIPVVLFQTVASFLKIKDAGITYGRYYVILFGIFATITGFLLCLLPVRKNGILAPILLFLSVFSIVPPTDAFTLSRLTQIARLEQILEKNNMLQENVLLPNNEVSVQDQNGIISAVNYLDQMDYTKGVVFLSEYTKSRDFKKSFGFERIGSPDWNYQSYYCSRDRNDLIPVAGYDYMLEMSIYNRKPENEVDKYSLSGEKDVILRVNQTDPDDIYFVLENENGQELVRFQYNQLFLTFTGDPYENEQRKTAEMTFTSINDKAGITVVANSISMSEGPDGQEKSADFILFIQVR